MVIGTFRGSGQDYFLGSSFDTAIVIQHNNDKLVS